MDTALNPGAVVDNAERPAAVSTIPWYCFAVAFGAACIPIGTLWDISWHSTIGRDTFWTPAHIMIYLGGVVPGFTCGWLALRATFLKNSVERAQSVRVCGLYAPLGAWIVMWGALTMVTSAGFDDWWHNAYGLDVKILSPPHSILAAGMYAVALGTLILIASAKNRAPGIHPAGNLLFLFVSGVMIAMSTIILTEDSYPNAQRSSQFYIVSCATYPLYLVVAARASGRRWAATGAAAVYTLIVLLMIWILPLFRAQPLLAPIYNPVDRMVPPSFPILMIVPAFAIDLVMMTLGRRNHWLWNWLVAVIIGAAFLGLLLAVHWPFSKFLLSPQADNWFFGGGRHWPYFTRPGDWMTSFWDIKKDPLTAKRMAIALALAVFKTRIALTFGNWIRQVKR